MLLDDLHSLIETLQVRISEHGPALSQSEALTRYALIDPLLRGLGWDTGDPSQVIPEFRSTSGSADYALLNDRGQPIIIVEAKKLGTPVLNAVPQVIGYCIQDGYEYFAVTDGAIWELYETNRPGPLPGKQVIALDLRGPSAQTCLDALALWRPGASDGRLQPAKKPVVSDPTHSRVQQPNTAAPPAAGPGWISLSNVGNVKGKKPTQLQLPDGTKMETLQWSNVVRGSVEWLADKGFLTNEHLPIRRGNNKRFMIANTPVHSDGTPFSSSAHIRDFYVEMNLDANQCIRVVTFVAQEVGFTQDNSQFGSPSRVTPRYRRPYQAVRDSRDGARE